MPESPSAYWASEAPALMRELGSGPQGLSADKAALRLRSLGPNAIQDAASPSAVRVLLRQFQSPLVLILIFGAVVSLVVQEWGDALIILAIVLGSALLGFVQEHRASEAVTALRARLALTVQVLRDGVMCKLATSDLVPGDVIQLSAGNLIPADGIVLAARDFLVTEASLTGESFPVEKRAGVLPPVTPIAGRTNSVFLGTSVRSGNATVLVVKTGRNTALGAIAGRLATNAPETEFARGVRQFGYLLIRVMLAMVVFVLVVNQVLHRPVLESLLFAMALAVGITPELLPAIVSVTLSRGARGMAQRGVIVRRLEAIENLGSMDVLCTDKTGTLTEGVVTLNSAVDADGKPSDQVKSLAHLNAALETGIENPLDDAIIMAGKKDGLTTAGYTKVDEIPYDFIRKRLTIVVSQDKVSDAHLVITKGAVANVLAVCSTVSSGGTGAPLTAELRERLDGFLREKCTQGFRMLGLATRRVAAKQVYGRDDEAGMAFEGFLLFFDPPKATAAATIRDLEVLGIRVKIITGDNRFVAAHVAGCVGLDAQAMLTGAEIEGLKDESLWQRAEQANLFVEVDPQQKERIVTALQRRGHAVGYLGDGINDAPALHAADVGISVAGAVDVARESADVVLLKPDLDVLRQGVEEGRRTFANTLKYISITTSANFGNMVSMALATPLLPFLPLAATQILLNNFLSDLPAMAISTDNVDPETVVKAQRWRVGDVQRFMLVFGLLSTVFDLVTFWVLLKGFGANQAIFQTTWFVVSLLTELAVMLVLRTAGSALRSAPGRLLLWTTVAIAALAFCVPYLGPVASVFAFVPLPIQIIGTAAAIVAGYIVATEVAKGWFFRVVWK